MLLLMFMFLPFVQSLAMHGKDGGNGGVSVVCRNSDGKITSAETLDLFEGKNQFNLTYPGVSTNHNDLIKFAKLKMIDNPIFLKQFNEILSDVLTKLVFLPNGIGLKATEDDFPIITKKGCKAEQLANYEDKEEKIYIDEEIYAKLSEYDKAAFFIHETIFKMDRINHNQVKSINSRKLTANLLAQNSDQDIIDSLMVIIAMPRLVDGVYATNANLCGRKISVEGDTLTVTYVNNPKHNNGCRDMNEKAIYKWGGAKISRLDISNNIKGYRIFEKDEIYWSDIIQVVHSKLFVDGYNNAFYLSK